jgi:predicted DCC family thiol-disulfide oxidoreductase YuxK
LKEATNILLFDGVCNLCNNAVKFIIKRDKKALIKFASLQSAIGQNLLLQHQLAFKNFDSFVYIKDDIYYLKSTAALHLLKDIGGIWKLFYAFIIIPPPIRDFIYSVVANNRYKWFGKANDCMIPTLALQQRFLK